MPFPAAPSDGSNIPITASQIINEFGNPPENGNIFKLKDYRKLTSIGGRNWPIDDNFPTGESSVKFSDFYGKQHNLVAVLSGGEIMRQTASEHFQDIKSTAYRSTNVLVRRTSKIIIYVIRRIGSIKTNRNSCALRTGTETNWYGFSQTSAKFVIRIGNGGALYGAGGDGGTGGTEETDGDDGQFGTSALGLQVNVESVIIDAGGIIQAGGGGGAGGGGSREDSDTVRRAGGGGGGGGAGLPDGDGGDIRKKDRQAEGESGSNGSLNSGGNGGNGGNNDDEARGGGGGGGGSFSEDGEGGEGGDNSNDTDGSNGSGSNGTGGNGGNGKITGGDGAGESSGGQGGSAGYAITRNSGLSAPNIVINGTIRGSYNVTAGVS